jgi:hypothetical protein
MLRALHNWFLSRTGEAGNFVNKVGVSRVELIWNVVQRPAAASCHIIVAHGAASSWVELTG